MKNNRLNIFILLVLLLLTAGAGTYVTFIEQPGELVRTDEAEKALALERSELSQLAMFEGRMRQGISYAAQRSQARYKTMQDSLTTADVVDYVNNSANQAFSSFDVEFAGTHSGPSHQYHSFKIRGSGRFEHLYDFLWQMENNMDLYRIQDLVVEAGGEESKGEVQFTMGLLAYFGAAAVMSAPEEAIAISSVDSRSMPMLPEEVLPARRLGLDPFSPLRTPAAVSSGNDLFSLRSATLISVLGEVAVFDRGGKLVRVNAGEAVQEGLVAEVDAARSRVVVTDRAGDRIVFTMKMTDLPFRRRSST